MELKDFYTMKPMKYYEPAVGDNIIQEIVNSDAKYTYMFSEKHDGEWSRVIRDENGVTIQSRSVSKKTGTYGDKTALVPHLVELFMHLPIGTVLLGELAFPEPNKTSQDVGAILRCLPQKAIERQKTTPLHWYGFDCLHTSDGDITGLGYINRVNYLKAILLSLPQDNPYIHTTDFYYDLDNLFHVYDKVIAKGGEGLVLQQLTYPYEAGSRKKYKTIKMKRRVDSIELLVVDTIDPNMEYKGNNENWGYVINNIPVTKAYYKGWKNGIVVDLNGVKCNVASGLTEEEQEWLASSAATEAIKNDELYAEITFMMIQRDTGVMRHPRLLRLRTDLIKEKN